MAQHNDLGKEGELLAEEYLRNKGYKIVERNWVHDKQEIDIIVSDAEFIIFVEVKTRSSSRWGQPEDAISDNKIKRMVHAADFYISSHNIDASARFDIIAIVINKWSTEIKHIEDAFLAPLN